MLPNSPIGVPPELFNEFQKIYNAINNMSSTISTVTGTPSTITQTQIISIIANKYKTGMEIKKDSFVSPISVDSLEIIPSTADGFPVIGIVTEDAGPGAEVEVHGFGYYQLSNYTTDPGMLFRSSGGKPQRSRSDQVIGFALSPRTIFVWPQPPLRLVDLNTQYFA